MQNMGNEDAGESSRKSEDTTNETPLKKARYVWQVKGKYHLKNSHKRAKDAENKEVLDPDLAIPTCEHNTMDKEAQLDQNSLPFHFSKIDCNLDVLLNKSEEIMNRDVSERILEDASTISDDVPVSLTAPNLKNEDYYLLRWQARQVAKGFVDNTINRVLEHWTLASFDAANFVENCDNDGKVEDEGILMAIQSHGLRPDSPREGSSGSQESRNPVAYQEIAKSALENANNELRQTEQNLDNQMDFLNAAVSVAISEKGLSSCSYE